ncbi:hypothetical protein H6B10_16905, partial [Gemmiger formicilis]|nr:hypothetical protein [Gemmiger formicilis]
PPLCGKGLSHGDLCFSVELGIQRSQPPSDGLHHIDRHAISTDSLRRMNDSEGLILQGCGGDLQEWLDGINEMFT